MLAFRSLVPRGRAAAGFCWRDHAIVAPLCGDDPRLLHSGHRSQGAHSDDSRPGGSAADLHHGGLEAPPVTHSVAFHRVRGKPAQWATKTSCAEWTGVLLSTLLKECGLKSSAT